MRLIASESPSLRRRRRRRTSGAVVGKRCITLVSLEMEGCGDGRRRCSAAEASTAPTPRRSSPTAAPRRAIRPLLNAAAAAFLDRKSSLEPLGVFLSQSVCLSLSLALSRRTHNTNAAAAAAEDDDDNDDVSDAHVECTTFAPHANICPTLPSISLNPNRHLSLKKVKGAHTGLPSVGFRS